MSILKSMAAGVSGLRAQGRAMDVIGDNIANVNTVGFKGSRVNFGDVMGNLLLGVGDGVVANDIQQLFDGGGLEVTGQSTDMAITGAGFFVVRPRDGEVGENFYTRAGQFGLDDGGFLSNSEGMRLQGYRTDDDGNILANQIGDIRVGEQTAPPRATGTVDLTLNLDPNEPIATVPWDPNNPTESSSYATSVTVYDSLGNAIQADVYYRKVNDNEWDYHVLVDGSQVTGGVAGTPVEITNGDLEFDTDGNLINHAQGAVTFDPLGATPGQNLVFTFDSSTQYAGDFNLERLRQDGFTAGDIRGVSIEADGTIVGIFSNGERLSVGQVVLAQFDSLEGLQREGGNLWSQSTTSGDPRLDPPGVGGRGEIASGALESSNIDLAYEFVKMIATQRGYQANAKTVTTADQLLQEVINLKR